MAKENTIVRLSLYHYDTCPYCAKVKTALSTLSLDELVPEMRNIKKSERYRRELVKQGGKQQVPALRIDFESGQTHWLYESDLIIEFLDKVEVLRKRA